MARDFTITMSMGMIVSVVVGFLIDLLGIEICTAITVISGQIQNLILLLFGKSYSMTLASFVFYTIFRQFLYPVFIASLTSRLGFKYFGILLGIGFALTGLAAPVFAALSEALQGDCHLYDESVTSCDHGHWILAHVLQFLLLGALLIIPWLDYRDRIERERRIKDILTEQDEKSNMATYGSDL
jgi:MFS family permease